jgi:hypothetical protein
MSRPFSGVTRAAPSSLLRVSMSHDGDGTGIHTNGPQR